MRRPNFLQFRSLKQAKDLIAYATDSFVMVCMLVVLCFAFEAEVEPQYVVLTVFLFALSFPSSWDLNTSFRVDVKEYLYSFISITMLLLLFGYMTSYLMYFSFELLVFWGILTPITTLILHYIFRQYYNSQTYIGKNTKHAVIVGQTAVARAFVSSTQEKRQLCVNVLGYFDEISAQQMQVNYLGSVDDVLSYIRKNHVDQIYIAFPSIDQRVSDLLDLLKDSTISIYYLPDYFVTDMIQGRVDNVDGLPIVALRESPFTGLNALIKRGSDIFIASIILCLISPLLVCVSIAVKLSSPGPVIFKQRRYGLDGKEIVVYKFRSMTVMEDGAQVTQAKVNDQRVTKVGRFIRKTSLDELPQFINVLEGKMSIVGPRPHAISHNELYRKQIKGYMVRHKVKPGITGWAQVNGYRGETTTLESMEKRIQYDLEYLNNWSLWWDIDIILKTIKCVFKDSKAY